MKKPNDYDNIVLGGAQLPAGGYVCRIMKVTETKSKSGKDMIIVALDVAEGDYKEHFARAYRDNDRKDKKWGCNLYILAQDNEGDTNRALKQFITSAEKSNEGFAVVWGDGFADCFKGKLIGIIFGREQFVTSDSRTAWSCKPKWTREADVIRSGQYEVPKDKPLPEDTMYMGDAVLTEDTEEDTLPF